LRYTDLYFYYVTVYNAHSENYDRMSKQRGIYLHGKSGNILYYSWKGIPCERMIPANVFQSPVVAAHKNTIGLSTTMGGSIRKMLADVTPYPKSVKMQTAVRVALLKWLKSGPVPSQPPAHIPYISGLSFNEAAVLKKCLHVPFTVTITPQSELSVLIPEHIPATVFTAPQQTDYIIVKLAVACCNIRTGDALQNYSYNISVPYNAEKIPPQTISLPLQMPADCLTIVTAALEYFTNKSGTASLLSDERFRPCQVIGGVVTVS